VELRVDLAVRRIVAPRVSANSRALLPAGKRGAAETPEEELGVIPLFRSSRGMRAVTVAH
jgi:hypothetical protein